MRNEPPLWERAQGRWASILPRLGVSASFLTGEHGPCPFDCGTDHGFRFDDKDGTGTWICTRCGAGVASKLLQRLHGWDWKTLCREVEAIIGDCPTGTVHREPDVDAIQAKLKRIAQGSVRLNCADPATAYLRARGLSVLPDTLRWHRALDYYDQGQSTGKHPAMLGLVQAPAPGNEALTYHVTYLGVERKADVPKPRKILTPVKPIAGGAIRLFPAAPKMGVAEGIETALAAHELTGLPVWSLISTSGMKSWQAPEIAEEVVVFGDNDKSFAGQAAAYELAQRLVTKHKRVSVEIPEGLGQDWLDVLNKRNEQRGGLR